MRTRIWLIVVLALSPLALWAQFDWGGGSSGPSEPWKSFKLDPKARIKLDFRNANVDMVISLYSKSSGINIVKDPALNGAITITSAKPVSLNEAFEILSATLSLKGYELRKEGSLLLIRQRSQGRGGQSSENSGSMFGGMSPDQIREAFGGSRAELKVYQIKYANASQIARVVNEVFATASDPFTEFMNMMTGGGLGQPNTQFGGGGGGGRGGRGSNQGGFGGGNRFQGFRGGGANFGRGGGSLVRASSDDFSNSVIVNAPSREHQQVEQIIRQIDRETDAPLQPRVYRLNFALADEVAPAVQNVLVANAPKGRGGVSQQNVPFEQRIQQAFRFGSSTAAFGTVVADARTNSLIISATEDNHKIVGEVIKELDMEVKVEASAFVVPLNNARADDLAGLLNQAFGQRTAAGQNRNRQAATRSPQQRTQGNNRMGNQGGGGGGGGNQRGGLGGDSPLGADNSGIDGDNLALDLEDPEAAYGELLTSISVMQGGFLFPGGQQRQPSTSQATGRDVQGRVVNTRDLTNQITVIPDQNTNSLIVVTSPDNVDLIRRILEQLDRIPEQVLIETIIVEATLDSSTKFGIEWKYTQSNPFGKTGSAISETGFGVRNTQQPPEGFRYTLTAGNFEAFLNALEKDTKFQVLSTPRIFTSNNAEAQINISQRVPYVLSTREDPNGNLTFTYAFQDVGIILTVTPRITSNGYVTMDIEQTANDLQGFTDFNAPIVNQRQADTTVSVRDGETVVLGGIIRNTVTSTVKRVPLLGRIPILGELFKSTDRSNVKTELLVFLTPRVVRDPAEAKRLREQQESQLSQRSQESVKNALPPPPPPDKSSGGATPPKTGGKTGG